MKMKQFFSVLIAISLALTLTVPVWASEGELPPQEPETVDTVPEDTTQNPEGTEIPDDTQTPDDTQAPDNAQTPDDTQITDNMPSDTEADLIDVVVPAAGQMILNPYNLPVETDSGRTGEQIIHQPQELVNYSDFPVIVTAVASGTLAGDAWFVSTPPAQDALDKEIFLYAEFQNQPDLWADGYSDAPNQLLVNDIAKDVITLEAGETGYFRLSGAMTPFPQNMWGEENALSVTISYTFTRDPASIDVVEPVDPMDPANTEEPPGTPPPLDLVEPVEPVEPTDTEEPPGTPPPLDMVEPVDPVEPSDPFEPTDTTEPLDPVEQEEPTDTTEPSDTVEPEEPTDTTGPSDTVEPVESVDPIEPADTEEPPGTPPPLEPYEDLEQGSVGIENP